MSRKRISKLDDLPRPGQSQLTNYLPRDIRLGTSEDTRIGTLLLGWDETTGTRQLWEIITTGPKGKSMFLGFVASKP